MSQIAAHVGVTTRGLTKMRLNGIKTFGTQLAIEIMAGEKSLKQ